jgi:hypothetical protein
MKLTYVLISTMTDFGAGVAQSVEWLGYELDDRRSIPGRHGFFLFATEFRLSLDTTQSPIQWVPVTLSPGKAALA